MLSAALLSGCYSYQTVNVADVPVGAPLRARLTPNEAARVGDILGMESRVFEGELFSRPDSATLVLRIPTLAREHSASLGVTYQNITVPTEGVTEVEVRKLDRARTTAVMAASGAALAAAVTAAFVAMQQPDGGAGKGGTDAFRPSPFGRP